MTLKNKSKRTKHLIRQKEAEGKCILTVKKAGAHISPKGAQSMAGAVQDVANSQILTLSGYAGARAVSCQKDDQNCREMYDIGQDN